MTFYRKYKWLMPILLFTTVLIACRCVYSWSLAFIFLPWNLLLAAMPLYFSFRLTRAANRKTGLLYLLAWLLFFPNAMYIVTDLFHLKDHPGIPKWYDLLILISAAITGVIMGFISLLHVEGYLCRLVGNRYMKLIIFTCFMLCGYGVYLGRYLRWNSWDVIIKPFSLFADIAQDIIHPFRNIQCWSLTMLFGVWLFILYSYFKKFRTDRLNVE